MYPTLIFWFIHSYGLMLAAGFYAAWWLAARRAKAEGISSDIIANLVLISVLGGVAGARLMWFALYRDPDQTWWSIFNVWEGGLVFYGGLIGAALTDFVYVRRRGLNAGQVADVAAPAISIGQAFGRIGCFLNGCCFGGVCSASFPLGVRFPAFLNEEGAPIGSPAFVDHVARHWSADNAAASLPIHATQLYTSASLFVITALLVAATPYRRRHGELLGLLCILHAVMRLGMELVRRDSNPEALGLTAGQLGAIVVLALGVALFAWIRLRGKPVPWEREAAEA